MGHRRRGRFDRRPEPTGGITQMTEFHTVFAVGSVTSNKDPFHHKQVFETILAGCRAQEQALQLIEAHYRQHHQGRNPTLFVFEQKTGEMAGKAWLVAVNDGDGDMTMSGIYKVVEMKSVT